jgi:hypothetical protein
MFKSIFKFSFAAFVGVNALMASANAAALSQSEQVALQAAMQRHIDGVSVNGAVLQIAPDNLQVVEYFLKTAHPKMMRMNDKVILCADFVDAAGKPHMGNFYMAKRDNDYVVFQTSFDSDPILEKLMKEGQVEMAN